MSNTEKYVDATSADKTEIGFEYQYYYFLYQLLTLKDGQSIGLEIKDDVHTELDNDHQILFQLKHTLGKNASGNASALTTLDIDLWKTLYNWAMIITDKNDNRSSIDKQIEFLHKTEFHLVTNKTSSKGNTFLSTTIDFQDGKIDEDIAIKCIESINTNNKKIISYKEKILQLQPEVLSLFLKKIIFEFEVDDLIYRIKRLIKEKMISEDNLDNVFRRLDSNIREDNYISIKEGRKISISFGSFYDKYREIFVSGRNNDLIKPHQSINFPDDIFQQKFIIQLLAINHISHSDENKAMKYTEHKIRLENLLNSNKQQGRLLADQVNELHENVIEEWENEFDNAHDTQPLEMSEKAAQHILYTLKKSFFTISDYKLNKIESNGELYLLSELNRIGWHRNWKHI